LARNAKNYKRSSSHMVIGGMLEFISGGTLKFSGNGFAQSYGKIYYVNANATTSGDGLSWTTAFKTMAEAFAFIASGDTIFFCGKIREQLTTPVQVFDVTIIGAGNRPRHADSTPAGGQLAANTWTTPVSATAATPLLKVIQQGWNLVDVLFAGPTDAASVLLYRDGGSGNAERDASHAEFHNCRFASGQDGIEQSGGCYNVGIYNCSIHDITGYALKNTAGAGIAAPYRWQIKKNRFNNCANWMGAWDANNFEIHDNTISKITTALINTSGGAGYNTILRNSFDIAAANFDPAGGVTGHATDVWSNYLLDTIETGLPAN
jgi:hypothetical protein